MSKVALLEKENIITMGNLNISSKTSSMPTDQMNHCFISRNLLLNLFPSLIPILFVN